MAAYTLASVAVFALVHLFVGRLRFLAGTPRSRWLSLAGGVAVSYVFLHVLPELSEHQETVEARGEAAGANLVESEIYLVSLAGLAVFYGLERLVSSSRARSRARGGADDPEAGAFWLHAGSFAAYNVLIGYLLLHREQAGPASLAMYTLAMALHFVTSDFGLRQHYKARYDALARWIFAAAVGAGWLLGRAVEVSEVAVGVLFAFLAGGVVLNVLKEELPEERESRFAPFVAGLVAYAILLQLAG